MISLYNTIGSNVVSLPSAKLMGIASAGVFKNFKLAALELLDDKTDKQNYIDAKNIFSFGTDSLTLKCDDVLNCLAGEKLRLLGASVYNHAGEIVGKVEDALFKKSSLSLSVLKLDVGDINFCEIYKLGDGIIILKGEAKFKKSKNKTQQQTLTSANTPRQIVSTEQNPCKPSNLKSSDVLQIKLPLTACVDGGGAMSVGYEFLLGRKMIRPFIMSNGKTELNIGETISQKTIEKALTSGMLKFLLKNSI